MARVILAFVLLLWSSVAHAEKRVALVIGNSAYQKVGKLLNPANDARALAGMLQAANFDEVTLRENLGIRELRKRSRISPILPGMPMPQSFTTRATASR